MPNNLKAIYIMFKNLMRLMVVPVSFFGISHLHAWEAYEFEVSYVSTVAASSGHFCVIGVKNLGPKAGEDAAICDNPVEIHVANCGSDHAQTVVALAMMAKGSNTRVMNTAVAEYSSSPCKVHSWQFRLVDD